MFESFDNAITSLDASTYSGPDALKMLQWLTRHNALTQAAIARFGVRLEETNAHVGTGHRDAVSVVATATGGSRSDAAAVLSTGRALEERPETAAAFDSGSISFAKAREIALADASAESELLAVAQSDSLRALHEEARRLRPGAGDEYEKARASCYLSFRPSGRYTTDFYGRLLNEEAAKLQARLSPLAKQAFRAGRKSNKHRSQGAYDAEALVMLAEQGDSSTGGSSKPVKTSVNVVVDYDALVRGEVGVGERCEVPGVGALPLATVQDMLNDCYLRVLVKRGRDVLALGSESRYIPAGVRASLNLNAQVCSVRGCDANVGLELDHRDEVQNGGKSKSRNLAYLCRWHHYLKTHKGYFLRGPTGDYELIPPSDVDNPMLFERALPEGLEGDV